MSEPTRPRDRSPVDPASVAAVRAKRRARPPRGPGRPAGANGDETRARILRAGVETFARRGFTGTSVRDVARTARIRVSTLYYYFPSKADLYREVQEHVHREVRELVVSALVEERDLKAGVRASIGAVFDFFRDHRAYLELGYRAVAEPPTQSVAEERFSERWLGLVEGLLRPAQARGEVLGVDLGMFMITVDGIVHWHLLNDGIYERLVGGRLDDPATAMRAREHVIEVALRILGLSK